MKVSIVYYSKSGNTERMAELIKEGAESVAGVEAKTMSVDDPDTGFLEDSKAVLFGSPTYQGTTSWNMKKFFDTAPVKLNGKLAGFFASQNWPGGGGGSFNEMIMIAAALVHGMLIYSGGTTNRDPLLHFGAVSEKSPEGNELYMKRCRTLGQTIAAKAKELF